MEIMTSEKRQIPRLNLRRPIDASLSGLAVALLDLSNGGAQIEHEVPLSAGILATIWKPALGWSSITVSTTSSGSKDTTS